MNSLILIGIIVGVILVISIIIIVIISKNKNKTKEVPASILDVQNIGVSTSDQEFSYGYEKEETIVMDPVTNDQVSEVEEKSVVQNNNTQNAAVLNVSTDEAVKEVTTAEPEVVTESNDVEVLEEITATENSVIEPIDEIEELK